MQPESSCCVAPPAASPLQRLNALLPLAARQQALTPPLRFLHRKILHTLAENSGAPELFVVEQPGISNLPQALAALASADLIVRGASGEITGAYPLTIEHTPHRVTLGTHTVNAMCAVDALALSPMFGLPATIHSRCHHCGRGMTFSQQDRAVSADTGIDAVRIGIAWRSPGGCAAHSLCREMVFICTPAHADAWRQTSQTECSLLTLPEAVDLACAFFLPLLDYPA